MMKGFTRENQMFSLCGLNCGLCPMFIGKYCGGCGNGNQSCKIARCSLEHGAPEYCYECECYPCEKYEHVDEFDSFITHRRQKADLEKAKRIGIAAYNAEQSEKIQILQELLDNFNDGRRKIFFCIAVNLLELSELREALAQIETYTKQTELPVKEKSLYAARVLQRIADRRHIKLRLCRKRSR